jgi:two-component sensor histidine kinase
MDRPSQRLLQRLPFAKDRPVVAYGTAVILTLLSAAMRTALDPIIPPAPYLTFFPAVIFSAFLFGRGPGIVSALLSGLLAWNLFLGPAGEFHSSTGELVSLALFALVITIVIAVIHWMQRANRWLVGEREKNRLLAEKMELLFRELQHRVSNNIQVPAALLALQKRDIEDERARAAIDEAARRLSLIGKIHRQLHDPSGARVGMSTFLRELSADLIDANAKPGVACSVEADDTIALDPDAVIPVALIIAEAVANALEHGFADRDQGHISLSLKRNGGGVEISVTDDGKGLPEGFDVASSKSLGLRIARTFARQLGGRFEMINGNGTTARLLLPV